MTSGNEFYHRPDGNAFRFNKHMKGDASRGSREREDKTLGDAAGLGRIKPDVDAAIRKEVYPNQSRLSFADPVLGSKRHDRLTLERDLEDATAQVDELRQKNRSLRHQLNLANQEREQQSSDCEKAFSMFEKSRSDQKRLITEIELIKKENATLQMRLDQTASDYQDEAELRDAVTQVQQLTKDKEELQRHLLEELGRIKDSLDETIHDRDDLKYQLSEMQREKDKLLDKLANIAPGFESAKSELSKVTEQRDFLKTQSKDLKKENQHLHFKLTNHTSEEYTSDCQQELESLHEKCSSLEQERTKLQQQVESMRRDRQHSAASTDDEGLGSMSDYRHTEDLCSKMATLNGEKQDVEDKLESSRKEIGKLWTDVSSAKEQIKQILREKGVALRESSAIYEESVQIQSQLVEVQTERDCAVEQRKIAAKEKERIIAENVGLKNKLEAIMLQRQKDAKELGSMRRAKEYISKECSKLQHRYQELEDKTRQSEEEMSLMTDMICSQLNIESKGSVSAALHRFIDHVQLEKDAFLSRLFVGQKYGNFSFSDACARLDAILHEKNCLASERDKFHRGSSDKEQEKIAKLNKQVNNLTFDRDALQEEVDKMESKIARHSAELKRCSAEIQRLQDDKGQLKASYSEVVEQHAKTLERVDDLWKHRSKPQMPQIHWDKFWDEKHVSVDMGATDGAGFAIMGGRDQQQLPNPNAIIVTQISPHSPAYQHLMPGDVLESVNGVSLSNVDHQDAICAMKENKGLLNMVIRRCRNPMAFQELLFQNAANSDSTNVEEHDFSLLITKDGIGFKHDWSISYQVTDVFSEGPANQILLPGDKITKVNGMPVTRVKGSAFKKLLKPHKGVLKLQIVRQARYGQHQQRKTSPLLLSGGPTALDYITHRLGSVSSGTKSYSRSSSEVSNDIGPEAIIVDKDNSHRSGSRGSYDSKNSSNLSYGRGYSSRDPTRDSYGRDEEAMAKMKASNLYSPISIPSERPSRDEQCRVDPYEQSMSQDSTEMSYSVMPTKLVINSQDSMCTGSTCSSSQCSSGSRVSFAEHPLKHGAAEKYISDDFDTNNNSNRMFTDLSSQSINLSFHSQSFISHNQLTVETTQTLTGSEDDEPYAAVAPFARDDVYRTTVRTRSTSSLTENRNSLSHLSNGYQAESEYSQFSQSSQASYNGNYKPKYSTKRSVSIGRKERKPPSSYLSRRGSRTPTGSTVSTSTITSAKSLSNIDDKYCDENDPLSNATYLRANFAYVPRYRKELRINIGDVFTIHDESPEHHKASFWVSRLDRNGTDCDMGAIPNSSRSRSYIEQQGQDGFGHPYTEVEPYTRSRPVLIFGVAIEPVIEQLIDEHPTSFTSPITKIVDSNGKETEAKLKEDLRMGKIISYTEIPNGSFRVLTMEAIRDASKKGKHCLIAGDIDTYRRIGERMPLINIFIKAQTAESISTFDPINMDPVTALSKFEAMKKLEYAHGDIFTATLLLIMLEVLVVQIQTKVEEEQKNMAWVPVK